MRIKIKRLIDPEEVIPEIIATITDKPVKKLTYKVWQRMILAEHSPIYSIWYQIKIEQLPYYSSTHSVRHKYGIDHYVQSQRVNGKREEVPQGNLINQLNHINVQALINIARVRLCKRADSNIRNIIQTIKDQFINEGDKYDVAVGKCMQPKCVWFGGRCPEFNSCKKHKDMFNNFFN